MAGRILGDFSTQPDCHVTIDILEAHETWVDCRVPNALHIAKGVEFGYQVKLITQTHDLSQGPDSWQNLVGRPIYIERGVWIASFSILYNCKIGEGAIVALGSVVRSMEVKPWTMVAGNPAVVIGEFDRSSKTWRKKAQ